MKKLQVYDWVEVITTGEIGIITAIASDPLGIINITLRHLTDAETEHRPVELRHIDPREAILAGMVWQVQKILAVYPLSDFERLKKIEAVVRQDITGE